MNNQRLEIGPRKNENCNYGKKGILKMLKQLTHAACLLKKIKIIRP